MGKAADSLGNLTCADKGKRLRAQEGRNKVYSGGLIGSAAKGPSQVLGVQRSVLQSCGAEKGQVHKVQFLQGSG